ncbi:MAG: LLM class flavin-dependent oxidoreductase, partial [Hansschlegelia sp.]
RVADIRRLAGEAGRDPLAIKIFALATVVTGSTDVAAENKLADFRRYVSPEGALTLMSGWTGVDLSTYQLDEEVRHVETDAGRTAMENITRADPSRVWTVRQVAEQVGIGGIGPIFVGSPATVADLMEAWIAETGVDGFNLAYAIAPETFEDIVEHVVPELQRRGRYKRAYAPGTLREKLLGAGPRLPRSHPAADFRSPRTQSEAAE